MIGALAEYDIQAFVVGGHTMGYIKSDRGLNSVDVMVRHADIDRAKQALAEIVEGQGEIDWSTVDVGESDDSES